MSECKKVQLSKMWDKKNIGLTVFVAHRHDPIHVIGVVDNECGEILDVHSYVRPFLHLSVKQVTGARNLFKTQ